MIVNKQAKESMGRQHTICNINRRVTTRGSGGGGLPCPFSKFRKVP